MRYYAIVPKNGLSVVKDYTHYLVVAQWLRDQDYRVFFKGRVAAGCHLILDNGAYEFGEAMPDDEYWMFIGQMKPKIVVVPDVWQDGDKTISRAENFLDEMEAKQLEGEFELMGVPQGKDLRDWIRCYEMLCPLVDVIGLPMAQWGDHTGKVRYFLATKVDRLKQPRIHLLGLWNTLELQWYYDAPRVQSIDTSMPFKRASHNLGLNGNCIADWKLDWEQEYSKDQLEMAKQYIQIMQELCK